MMTAPGKTRLPFSLLLRIDGFFGQDHHQLHLLMSTDLNQSEPFSRQLAMAIAILAATCIVYIPAVRCGYIWDDDDYVLENETLRTTSGLRSIWCEPGATPQYYPMVHTTYWTEYQLWGDHPTGYHLVNIFLHALNAILLWKILRFLEVPGALLAGLLFALHPVHVESVAWITERKNILSGFFYLLSAWCYLRCMLSSSGKKRSRLLYYAALVLFATALLSKSVTATLPAALLLVITWKRGRFKLTDILPLLPMVAAAIPMVIVTSLIEKYHVGTMHVEWDLSLIDRCLIAGRATWFYAVKLLLPLKLTFIYPRWVIDSGSWWQYLFPCSALALVWLFWWQRTRLGSGPLVGLLFFGGTLVPALGFVDVYPMRFSFVADHFQYLASIGLLALGAATLTVVLQRPGKEARISQGRLVIPAGLLAVLGVLAWVNCAKYQNLDTLWTDTVQKNPNSQIALNSLGAVRSDQRRFTEAMQLFKRSLECDPEYAEAHNNLAIVYGEMGDLDQAYRHLREAIKLQPNYRKAHLNLAEWYFQKAALFYQQGQLPESEAALHKAISLSPECTEAYNLLGRILLEQGKPKEAIDCFQQALKLEPKYAEARINLERARIAP